MTKNVQYNIRDFFNNNEDYYKLIKLKNAFDGYYKKSESPSNIHKDS